MFFVLTAFHNGMSGALTVVDSTFAAWATGFVSGEGADCYDSPHPTTRTAAIVMISMCFISLKLSILFAFPSEPQS